MSWETEGEGGRGRWGMVAGDEAMLTRSVLRVRGAFFFEVLLQPGKRVAAKRQKETECQTGLDG